MDLRSAPRHVATKLLYWVGEVETNGLGEPRKQPGFHDDDQHRRPHPTKEGMRNYLKEDAKGGT